MLRMVLVALFLISPACKKVSEKTETESADLVAASRPITDLGDVMATVQMPSGTDAGELAKLIDNVQPGASAFVTAQLPMVLGQVVGVDLSAADLSGPVALVVLNPEKYDDPFALLVKSKKADALIKTAKSAGKEGRAKNGLVLLGAPDTVAAAEAFAFANLVRPSKQLVAIAYPAPLVKAYQKKFDEMTAMMKQGMAGNPEQGPFLAIIMDMYKEMFTALGEQSDRIVVTLGTEGKSSEVYFRLYPKAGTTMAAFTEAQVPADHKLLSLLPASPASGMIFVGDMRAGSARDALFDFSMRMMAAMYSPELGPKLETAARAWMDSFDGDFAATMDMTMGAAQPKMSMNYLMGTTDSDKTRAAWRELMRIFADATKNKPNMMGMSVNVEFMEKVRSVDSVEIDSYKTSVDRSAMEPQMAEAMSGMDSTMYLASFDKVAAMSMAMGDADASAIDAVIASVRGKAKGFSATGSMAEALAQSKRRKESILMVFDVGALAKDAPQPMPFSLMSMGFGKDQSGALLMRMSITP